MSSLQYGDNVTIIKRTFSADDDGHGILIFEDNGVGIPDEDKEKLFSKNFGTTPDLFLAHEIFSLTDMTIKECGQFGKGIRFLITIPPGYWERNYLLDPDGKL